MDCSLHPRGAPHLEVVNCRSITSVRHKLVLWASMKASRAHLDATTSNFLPLPARNEWGEGWGEGHSIKLTRSEERRVGKECRERWGRWREMRRVSGESEWW